MPRRFVLFYCQCVCFFGRWIWTLWTGWECDFSTLRKRKAFGMFRSIFLIQREALVQCNEDEQTDMAMASTKHQYMNFNGTSEMNKYQPNIYKGYVKEFGNSEQRQWSGQRRDNRKKNTENQAQRQQA